MKKQKIEFTKINKKNGSFFTQKFGYFCDVIFLNKLFQFYINTSIHVALSVYALLRITEFYFEIPYQKEINYFIFFATITGYNFIKYAGVAKFYHQSLTNSLRVIQIFSFICFCLMLYYAYKLPSKTLLFFVPFAAITLLYAIPFLAGFQKSLREISYLKIFVVAFVWSAITAFIPLYLQDFLVDVNAVLYFSQRFLLVVVLTLPFEIRDVALDFDNVKTLPQKIGIQQTKKLGFALLLFALVLEFLITDSFYSRNIFLSVCFVLLIFLMRSKEKQSKFYSSFWVESIPVFWWILLLLFG